MAQNTRRVALVTGGSRGIGAATALALGKRGYDVTITYRNKGTRAQEVVEAVEHGGGRALAIACDITHSADLERLFAELRAWAGYLDALVLNASGGLERERLALDPDYPMRINRDAQLWLIDRALPLLRSGSTIVLVTSHWAHLYGQVPQLPAYDAVAASKYAGERALRDRMDEFARHGVRLAIVTGDLIEGTITPKLLERAAPGLAAERRGVIGALPTAEDMGEVIASAATDSSMPSGHVFVVGGSLESLRE